MKIKLFYIALGIGFISSASAFAQTKPIKVDSTLEINRNKIDLLDKKLIEILGEREKAVKEIGKYKSKNHIPPLQSARFQDVLNQAIEEGKLQGLSPVFITELMNAIHKESLRIEEELKK